MIIASRVLGGKRRRLELSPALLLSAGFIVAALSLAVYVVYKYVLRSADQSPADLQVFLQAGLVVRHAAPYYNAKVASPLYDWPAAELPFTYPPFAAIVFLAFTVFSLSTLAYLSVAVSLVALGVALWATFRGLGYKARTALGGSLLVAGVVLWTEPVLQTLSLGQVELVLMAVVIWDMVQPDERGWKGVGVGIAAGIKLVPLIFIPYLLLTRRFRAAAVATGTFAVTVLFAWVWLPSDSWQFWLDGDFAANGRGGFPGRVNNQSLNGMITRLAGSVAAGHAPWLAAAIIVGVLGLALSVAFNRSGHGMVGLLTCALTSLLISPVSWDHHWVWIAPAIAVLGVYAVRYSGTVRWTCLATLAVILIVFAGWPQAIVRHLAMTLWGQAPPAGGFFGLIFAVPSSESSSAITLYDQLGDSSKYAEYHWYGAQLMVGNAYVLTGIGLFILLAVIGLKIVRGTGSTTYRARHGSKASPWGRGLVNPLPAQDG